MKIFAVGEAQSVEEPGVFKALGTLVPVVGIVDLGGNNGSNDYGWSGVKAVVRYQGDDYILDFPEETRLETESGLCLFQGEAWLPSLDDCTRHTLPLMHF